MRSFIFGLMAFATSLSSLANPNLSLLVSSPVDIELSVDGSKLDLKGQLNLDTRMTSDQIKETNFVAEIRNLGVVVRKVPRKTIVIKPDAGSTDPIDIGISLAPGTEVKFEYDKSRRLLQATLDVEIELPGTGSYDDVDEKSVDQTSRDAQKGTLTLKLGLSQDLDNIQTDDKSEFGGSIEISLVAREFNDDRIHVRSFAAQAVANTATFQVVNLVSNVIFQTMCVQPISVVKAVGDLTPPGYATGSNGIVTKDSLAAQQGAMDRLWGEVSGTVAGIKIRARPWMIRVAPELNIIEEVDTGLLTNSDKFPNLSGDCVEIYFVAKIERRSLNGAMTVDGGASDARIILSDEIVERGYHGRLAHEFGHVVRIPHPNGPPRGGDHYVGSTGTLACVYGPWGKDQLNRNSADNIAHIWIPAVLQGAPVVLPSSKAGPVECKQNADCGGC